MWHLRQMLSKDDTASRINCCHIPASVGNQVQDLPSELLTKKKKKRKKRTSHLPDFFTTKCLNLMRNEPENCCNVVSTKCLQSPVIGDNWDELWGIKQNSEWTAGQHRWTMQAPDIFAFRQIPWIAYILNAIASMPSWENHCCYE